MLPLLRRVWRLSKIFRDKIGRRRHQLLNIDALTSAYAPYEITSIPPTTAAKGNFTVSAESHAVRRIDRAGSSRPVEVIGMYVGEWIAQRKRRVCLCWVYQTSQFLNRGNAPPKAVADNKRIAMQMSIRWHEYRRTRRAFPD